MADSQPPAPYIGQKFPSISSAQDFVDTFAQHSGCSLHHEKDRHHSLQAHCIIHQDYGAECPFSVLFKFDINDDLKPEWTVSKMCLKHITHKPEKIAVTSDVLHLPFSQLSSSSAGQSFGIAPSASSPSTSSPIIALSPSSSNASAFTASYSAPSETREASVSRLILDALKKAEIQIPQIPPSAGLPAQPILETASEEGIFPSASPDASDDDNVLAIDATFPTRKAAETAIGLAMKARGYTVWQSQCTDTRLGLACRYGRSPSTKNPGVSCPCRIIVTFDPSTEKWTVTELNLEHKQECLDVYAGKVKLVRDTSRSGEATNLHPLTHTSDSEEYSDASSDRDEEARSDSETEGEQQREPKKAIPTPRVSQKEHGETHMNKATETEAGQSELFLGLVFPSPEVAAETIKTTMSKHGYSMTSTGTNRGIRTYYRCRNHRTFHSKPKRYAGACKCHVFIDKVDDTDNWEITDVALSHTEECRNLYAGRKKRSRYAGPRTTQKASKKTVQSEPTMVGGHRPAKKPRIALASEVAVIPSVPTELASDCDIEYIGPVKMETKPSKLSPAPSSSAPLTRSMLERPEVTPADASVLGGASYKTEDFLSKLPDKVAQAFRDKGVIDKASFQRLNLQSKYIMIVLREYQKEYNFLKMEMDVARIVLEAALGEEAR